MIFNRMDIEIAVIGQGGRGAVAFDTAAVDTGGVHRGLTADRPIRTIP